MHAWLDQNDDWDTPDQIGKCTIERGPPNTRVHQEKERIRTACLGFGDGYNEDLLDELSKAASGALHDGLELERQGRLLSN